MAGLGRRSHYRKHLTDSVLNDYPEPKYPNERVAQIVGSRGGNFFDVIVSPPVASGTNDAGQSSISSTSKTNNNDSDFNNSSPKNEVADTTTDKINGNNSLTNQKPTREQSKQCKHRLAMLPTKFRKLVWVKRGDYVIVDCGDDVDDEENSNGQGKEEVNEECEEPQSSTSPTSASSTSLSQSKKEEDKGVRYMIQHILYKDQVKHLKNKGLWPDVFEFTPNGAAQNSIIASAEEDKHDDNENEYYSNDDYSNEDYNKIDSQNSYLKEDDFQMNANTNRMAHMAFSDDESDTDDSSSDEDNI